MINYCRKLVGTQSKHKISSVYVVTWLEMLMCSGVWFQARERESETAAHTGQGREL